MERKNSNSNLIVKRAVIVGLGFEPSHEDLDIISKVWKQDFPDYPIVDCICTLVKCPLVEGATDLLSAMKINWSHIFFSRFFAQDLIDGCEIKVATAMFNEREIGVWVSHTLPNGTHRSQETESLAKLMEETRKRQQQIIGTKSPSVSTVLSNETKPPNKYVSLGSLRSLSLNDLCHPLFPQEVRLQSISISPIEEEQIRRLVGSATSKREKEDFFALCKATEDLPLRFPDFGMGYLWRAIALSGLGLSNESFGLIEQGFEVCSDVKPLCQAFAYVYEKISSIYQLGWYMQYCLVGGDDYWAYLVLAHAALHCKIIDLSKKLFNAADILGPGWAVWRPDPEEIARIQNLVTNNFVIVNATLRQFTIEIDSQLPALDLLPDDFKARQLWLKENTKEREIAKKKLVSVVKSNEEYARSAAHRLCNEPKASSVNQESKHSNLEKKKKWWQRKE